MEIIHKTIIKILLGFGHHPRFNRFMGKIPLVKPLCLFMVNRPKNSIFNINDSKMFLDLDKEFWNIGYLNYEPSVTKIACQEIKKGDVVLDLGANIGYYSLLFSTLTGNEGKVFSFEPDPNNFVRLKRNIKINDYQNIVPIQKAVSDKNGKVKLFLTKGDSGGSTIGENKNAEIVIEVDSVRMDDYLNKVDFIKMDIESAEMSALQGMVNLLKNNVKIIAEFHPFALKRNGANPRDFLELLAGMGFKIREIKNGLKPVDIDKLLEDYPEAAETHTNLFCVKE